MAKLTERQYDNVNLAIELARKPGGCIYQDKGEPCCVIGQLAALEGTKIGPLYAADIETIGSYSINLDRVTKALGLSKYPKILLMNLQRYWDTYASRDELRELVDEFQGY